jgi:hypothetical protein
VKQKQKTKKKKKSDSRKGQPKPIGAGKPAQKIEVFDSQENETTIHDSINAAARALNIAKSVIDMYFAKNQVKPYKARYTFKKIQD